MKPAESVREGKPAHEGLASPAAAQPSAHGLALHLELKLDPEHALSLPVALLPVLRIHRAHPTRRYSPGRGPASGSPLNRSRILRARATGTAWLRGSGPAMSGSGSGSSLTRRPPVGGIVVGEGCDGADRPAGKHLKESAMPYQLNGTVCPPCRHRLVGAGRRLAAVPRAGPDRRRDDDGNRLGRGEHQRPPQTSRQSMNRSL